MSFALLRFWVEIWVENRRRPESVEADAGRSGSVHPAIRLLKQSFALKGRGTLRIWRSGCGPGTTVGPANGLRAYAAGVPGGETAVTSREQGSPAVARQRGQNSRATAVKLKGVITMEDLGAHSAEPCCCSHRGSAEHALMLDWAASSP